MANTVAITIRVNDAESSKISALRQEIERLKGSAGGGGNPFAAFSSGAKSAHGAAVELTSSSRTLREAIHALHPALEQLGIGFGNLRGLGSAARGSIAVFSAGLLGTLLVALEKVFDATERAKKSLADLGVAPAGALRSARELQTTLGAQADLIAKSRAAAGAGESYVRPQYNPNSILGPTEFGTGFAQGPGSGLREPSAYIAGNKLYSVPGGSSPGSVAKQTEALQKIFRLGSGSETSGDEAFNKFLDEVGPEGRLTPAIAQNLPNAGVAARLAKLLGINIDPKSEYTPQQQLARHIGEGGVGLANRLIAEGQISPEQGISIATQAAYEPFGRLLGAAGKQAPQIDKEYAEFQAKGPASLQDAVGHVKQSLNNLADEIGKSGLTKAIEGLASLINQITKSNFQTGLHAIAHPIETGLILAGKAKTQEEAEAKARYITTGEGAPATLMSTAPAGPPPIAPGPDYIRLSIRRKQWEKDHPGEPLPEGYAGGGLIGLPRFADGGVIGEIQEIIRKRGPHAERINGVGAGLNIVGIGAVLKALKLTSPFLQGTGLADGGAISGPGSGTSDSILIRASNGEYAMNARATRRLGVDFLDSLNRFADGGPISFGLPSAGDDTPSFTPARGASIAPGSQSSGPNHSVHLDFLVPPVEVKTDEDTLRAVTSAAVKHSILQIAQRQSSVG
jgi:hypothetical protein